MTATAKKPAQRSNSTVLESKGQFSFPRGMGIFPVIGDCMEPVIREGQMLFAVKQDSPVAIGTPVIVHTIEKTLIKLWGGARNGRVTLRFLNDGNGKPGSFSIPAQDITEIWSIRGIWYNGVPPTQAGESQRAGIPVFSPEGFAAMVAREGRA